MAGGEQLNSVDYPPLPSVNQNQNKQHPFSSSQTLDRANFPSNSKVLPPSKSSPICLESIDLVIGSMIIPSSNTIIDPRISIPQPKNCESAQNPKPPSLFLASQKCTDPQPKPPPEAVRNPSPQLKVNTIEDNVQGLEISNLAKAFLGTFNFQPCHQVLGKTCVSFSMEEKQSLINSMNFIVIVKFSHFRPKFHAFHTFLKNMGFLGKFRIIEYDLKHVFVEFMVFEDFCKLWMMQSCFIGGFRGRFFKWDGDFVPSVESFIAPIWVHLPHFPLYLFYEKAIMSVANVFGKPLFIDPASLNRDRVGKLSVCVAKDVRVKGPNEILIEFVGNGIIVERFTQLVNYGEIPDYCSKCLHMGHCFEDCKVLDTFDKGLGHVSTRLKEVVDVGNNIPVVAVFERINTAMSKEERLVEKNLVNVDMVMVEVNPVSENEGIGLGNLSNSNSDSLTDTPLVPQNTTPGAVGHGLVSGEEHGIMASQTADLLTSKSDNIPSTSSAQPLEPLFSNPGAAEQGLFVGDVSMLSKDEVQVDKDRESGREEQEFAAENSADASKITGLLKTNSDSSVAPSLELDISMPGAALHSSLAGDLCMISKDDVNTDKCLESSREDLQFLTETSVDALQNNTPDTESFTNQFLKASNFISGASGQEGLAGSSNMLFKEGVQLEKVVESGGEKLENVDAISADKPKTADLQLPKGSVSSSALSLEQHNTHPEAVGHGSKAGDHCLTSKVVVPAVIALETTREEHDFVAETSVAEPFVADQIMSKALNISIAGSPSLGSLEGTSGDVLRWLGKNVGKLIQDKLQQQELDNGGNMEASKVVIKHPVTKEIIHLPHKSTSTGSPTPKSLVGLSKNAKKKWKKKNKKLNLLKTPSSKAGIDSNSIDSASPLPICVSSQQDWDGLDSNGSKDTPFWTNFHAAQEDLSQIERPEGYPYMFTLDSEEERLSSSINSSNLDTQSSKDSEPGELDLQQLQQAYDSAADSFEDVAFDKPQAQPVESKAEEQVTPLPQSQPAAPKEVEVQVTKEIESQEQLDLLPLLEAYRKGHFDVQVTPSQQSWAEEAEATESSPLSFDELAGVPVTKTFIQASKKYHKGQFKPP